MNSEDHDNLQYDRREKFAASRVPSIPVLPAASGVIAALALAGLYVAIVGLAQDFNHALSLVTDDWYFVIPIASGFGTQIGLFVYARTKLRLSQGTGSGKAMTGAGTGTSTVSMVACCTHHLNEVLPLVGASGATLFLNEYRGPLMAFGIATNLIAIVLTVRAIRTTTGCGTRDRRQPTPIATGLLGSPMREDVPAYRPEQ
ncbi:MAG: hypothetical protein Q8P59_07540 [Dehalococcoidia bacterium]|nr:hypothetical protein [Dehalococcoidia bacterium]